MRALMDFPYNNGQVKNGEEFAPASDRDAELLKVFGRAEAVEEELQTKRKYRRRDMTAVE